MKIFSDQEIMQYLDQASQLIQDKITSRETIGVIVAIGKSKGLHIDQIGKLAELNRNMLLGLVTPQEFLDELTGINIPEKDAREILIEINQKIFIPLRKEEGVGGEGVKPVIEAPKPIARVERPLAPHIAPLPPKMAMPGQISSARQFGNGKTLLEDHEEPHIEFAAVPEVKKEAFLPKVEVSPENLPGAMPPIMPTTEEGAETPVSPVRKLDSFTPPIRTGSVDPYREPLDEPLR